VGKEDAFDKMVWHCEAMSRARQRVARQPFLFILLLSASHVAAAPLQHTTENRALAAQNGSAEGTGGQNWRSELHHHVSTAPPSKGDKGTIEEEEKMDYGQLFFKDVFESLDKIMGAIRPFASLGYINEPDQRMSTGVPERLATAPLAPDHSKQRAQGPSSGPSQPQSLSSESPSQRPQAHSSTSLQSSPARCSNNLGNLKAPRSVAEIRNQGGFSVISPTPLTPHAAAPPVLASPLSTPRHAAHEMDDSKNHDDAFSQHTNSMFDYVRGMENHLLRMASAKKKAGGATAARTLAFPPTHTRTHESTPVIDGAVALTKHVIQGSSYGINEAKRLLLGTGTSGMRCVHVFYVFCQ